MYALYTQGHLESWNEFHGSQCNKDFFMFYYVFTFIWNVIFLYLFFKTEAKLATKKD